MTVVMANFVDDVDKTQKPYIFHGQAEGFPNTNLVMKEYPLIHITDMRTVPDFKPTVDVNGFCFIEHKSKALPTLTDVSNSQAYATEMAALLKDLLGATTVVPVQTALRSANKEHMKAPPGTEAHIDTTMYDAWGRVAALISPEEQGLVLSGKYRARIMNLWRPMINHAEDFPLAVLDPASIDYENDHVGLDHVTPNMTAEAAYLKYNPNHRWYWMSNQTPDEAIVFTQYDTHPPKGVFNHVGHTAFKNPDARVGCPPRRSIEARFTVLEPAPYEKTTTIADPRPVDSRKQPWREFIDLPTVPLQSSWKPTFEREELQKTAQVA